MIAFVVVYRLLALARWDAQTAAAILQHLGSANVILGVAVSAAPAIITTALWFLSGLFFYRWARDRAWPGIGYGVLTLVTALVGFTIATGPQLVLMALLWCGAAFVGRQDRGVDPELAQRQNLRIMLGAFGGLVLSSVIISEASWLPTESITAEDREPFTAYVLSGTESEEWVVLRADQREVEFISGEVDRTRTLCDRDSGGWPGEWFWKRTVELLGGVRSADYPDCP